MLKQSLIYKKSKQEPISRSPSGISSPSNLCKTWYTAYVQPSIFQDHTHKSDFDIYHPVII